MMAEEERAENAPLRQMLEEVLRRLSEVEGQVAKDSHWRQTATSCIWTAAAGWLIWPGTRSMQASDRRDRHLAALWGTSDAWSVGQLRHICRGA